MRRVIAIFILIAFAALGSGALRYVHELAHLAELAHAHAAHGGSDHSDHEAPAEHAPLGDPAECFTHAQLNLPMLQAGYVPLLVCLGLFAAFLSALPAPAIRSRRPVLLLDCRGPPAV